MFCKTVKNKVYLHGHVMLCLGSSLDQELMDLVRNWVDIKEKREERNAYCVIMNVGALVMFCESVESTVL